MKFIVIGIALLAVVIGLHFNFGSFASDLYLRTQRKGAAIPADPTCPRGQYSKKTGGPCSGASSGSSRPDPPETARGANGERHNVGTYDAKPNEEDEVDYTSTDVLTNPASITYSDWALDPNTNKDIRSGSRAPDSQFRGLNDVIEDEDDLPSTRETREPYDYRYDTSLRSSRNFRNGGYHDEYDTEKKHEYAKKNRPSVDDLIRASSRNNSKIPRSTRNGRSEDDYLDNRLSRDYKTRERRFELPYQRTYNRAATSGYNSGTTCNNKSFGDLQEDECCEGFSTFK